MSDAQQSPLPIEALISDRLQDLKLTPVKFVRRCGYKKLSKTKARISAKRRATIYIKPSRSGNTTKQGKTTIAWISIRNY